MGAGEEAGAEKGSVRSLWLEEALAGGGQESAPRLEGEVRADVCIVGGGFTGLWTALRLKEHEPTLDVVVLEADVCGGGASGRNGGFVMSLWSKFSTLAKICGREEALRLAHASAEAVEEIGAFCREHAVDAGYRHDGWLWTATSPAQLEAWEKTVQAVEDAGGHAFERLDPAEVARRSGSETHIGGVFEASAASVHPAHLARALRRAALERGVRIFERSRMTRLLPSRPPRVTTSGGAVTADVVVLALNAWVAGFAELRRKLVVVASDVVATDPVGDRLEEIGWLNGLCISDSRRLVNYYRTTIDGRIVFGKGGGTLAFAGRIGESFHRRSPRAVEVAAHLHRLYPMLADVRATRSWRGPIDYSLDGLPFFTRLGGRPDIILGAGYSGNGVGPSNLGGRILASLALGRQDEWSTCGLARTPSGKLPPEPARFLGGLVVRAAIARKERREDEGGEPDPLTKAVAKLDPTSFVDRGSGAAVASTVDMAHGMSR